MGLALIPLYHWIRVKPAGPAFESGNGLRKSLPLSWLLWGSSTNANLCSDPVQIFGSHLFERIDEIPPSLGGPG